MTDVADVIVLGGGPSGSTVATLVAKNGHKVMLLDKEKHPRYQIGESLLPATIHGICPLLGVTEEIKKANFTHKTGGTFRWGANPEPWTFNFSRSPTLNDPTGYAYQVERSKFDEILLRNAQKKGVDVREQHTAVDVIFEEGRAVGIDCVDPGGTRKSLRARYVVDASGNTSNFYQKVGERKFSKFFQNVALFCYFENGKRLPPPRSGNIISAAFDEGWFWYIPLSPTLTSVGAVVAREKAKIFQDDLEQVMNRFIAKCPMIADMLSSATRVTSGPYGQFRIRKDYSYSNTKFWVPGMVLIGDSACFVDPVISSGVHLATYAGLLAARSLNSVLSNTVSEEKAFEEFEKRYRREYGNFYTYLAGFYDMHKDENSYFWEARKVVGTEEEAKQAFLRLVTGTATGEAIYSDANDMLSAAQGTDLGVVSTGKATIKAGDGSFMEDFDNREIVQTMMQSMFGAKRGKERPLFEGGLVPSVDGLHWRQP